MGNSIVPTKDQWQIYQGTTFTRTVTIPGTGSIAGWAARCTVRSSYEGPALIEGPDLLVWVSDGPAREVTVEIPATVTATKSGGGVADIEIESPIGVVVQGNRAIPVIIWPEATY